MSAAGLWGTLAICLCLREAFRIHSCQEEVPRSNPCGRGGDKDALYRWEPVKGFFLNARGRTASVDLYFTFHARHNGVPCITDGRTVSDSCGYIPDCNDLNFPGECIFWNGPKLVAKMWITAFWQRHGGRSLCIEDGRVDSMSQG
eukprot:1158231-Pelagomonas_calceolata.AAC.12